MCNNRHICIILSKLQGEDYIKQRVRYRVGLCARVFFVTQRRQAEYLVEAEVGKVHVLGIQ